MMVSLKGHARYIIPELKGMLREQRQQWPSQQNYRISLFMTAQKLRIFTDLQVNLYHYKRMDSNLLYNIKKLQGQEEISKKTTCATHFN